MPGLFPFQRPQGNVRSFFGLGPYKLNGLSPVVVPTLDVGPLLTTYQDQEQAQGTTAATAPGASSTVNLTPPREGIWLLDTISLISTGPVTSGSITLQGTMILTRGGGVATVAMFDGERVMNRLAGGAANTFSRLFIPPVILYRIPAFVDLLQLTVTNAAASVGNATASIVALWRQLPLVP